MRNQFLLHAALVFAAASLATGAQAQTRVFIAPANIGTASTQAIGPAVAKRTVQLNTAALNALQPGDEALLTTPDGVDLAVIHERSSTGLDGASIWAGHVRDARSYSPVVIVEYQGIVDGSVDGPNLHLRIEGPVGAATVHDLFAEGLAPFSPSVTDMVPGARNPLAGIDAAATSAQAAVAQATTGQGSVQVVSNSQIDLLFLYSPGLLSAQGSVAKVVARANALVTLANQIYTNSGMSVTLNLVAVQADSASYADQADSSALPALQSDTSVAALRNRYGADVVSLVRPFTGATCGLAYVPQDFTSFSAQYGYSVVEDGSKGSFFCDNSSMTHEIGHNYGANHDAGTQASQGAGIDGTPSYNRGYCNGADGTIMAYPSTYGCSTLAYEFSTPAKNNCTSSGTAACGIAQNTPYSYQWKDSSNVIHTASTSGTGSGADSVTAINVNAASIAGWRLAPKSFVALPPARLLDTRSGVNTVDGQYQGAGPLAASGQIDLSVANRGGMPFQGAGAAVMSVTTINANANGFLTFWPTGATRPTTGNINPTVGTTVSNLVITKVGSVALASPLSYTDSQVSIYNGATGSTNVAVNILGWLPAGSAYNAITPARFLDTRSGSPTFDGQAQGEGALAASATRNLQIGGRDGAPNTGSVVIKITGVQPGSNGFVTLWAAGQAQPGTGNVNLSPGLTMSNLAIVPLGTSGQISLYNGSTTPVNLTADVQGWFPSSSAFTAIAPTRLLDTRNTTPIPANSTLNLTVTNVAGIPTSAGAVVIKATAVTPASAGFLTVWPAGQTQPSTGNLNMTTGLTISNLVFVQPGTSGQVSLYNGSSTPLNVVVDAQGWFVAP